MADKETNHNQDKKSKAKRTGTTTATRERSSLHPEKPSRVSENSTKTKNPETEVKDESSSSKVAHKIIWHYRKYATLFHDQHGTPFIALEGNGRKVMPLESENFYNFISSVAFNDYNRSISDTTIKKIVTALKGTAMYGQFAKELHLEVRHFKYNDKTLWYDLGDSAVVIKPSGWKINFTPPILFKRFAHQERQDDPQPEGSIELLHKYVNIDDDCDWLLFQVFAISCFIPGFPKPLLVLNGAQGSGKSTPLRILKALIDPSKLKSVPVPKSVEELARVSDHHSILFFDNLSKMPMDVSDNLCRLSTGDGFSKRKLYTDDDDVVYELQRPIMFNGINQIITQADLLDRSIPIELQRISEDKRRTEDEIWREFYQDRPYILGAIFDILAKALTIYPTVQLDHLPRMADFAKWGYAIAEAMDGYEGTDFIASYDLVLDRQNEEALQASPVAQAIIKFMEGTYEWEGTVSELARKLDSNDFTGFDGELYKLNNSPMWPKEPSALGRSLNRVSVNLKNVGIEIKKRKENNQRIVKIINLKNKEYKTEKMPFLEDGSLIKKNYNHD